MVRVLALPLVDTKTRKGSGDDMTTLKAIERLERFVAILDCDDWEIKDIQRLIADVKELVDYDKKMNTIEKERLVKELSIGHAEYNRLHASYTSAMDQLALEKQLNRYPYERYAYNEHYCKTYPEFKYSKNRW